MPFYLQIEFVTELPDAECERQFVEPVRAALTQEQLGTVFGTECLDSDLPVGSDRRWEIAVEVTDTDRARRLVLRLLEEQGAR